MSSPSLRNRISSQPVVAADLSAPHGTTGVLPAKPPASATATTISAALARIMAGVFGTANPESFTANAQVAQVPQKQTSIYQFHEGDVFTPGTANYVFEPTHELTPLNTTWGMGFLRVPNTFSVYQPEQLQSLPTVEQNGIGGLVPGQWAMQPLESAS